MYQKYNKKDELFSNVLLAFVLLLLCGFLIYKKSLEDTFYDIEGYFYLLLSGILFGYFIYTTFSFFRNCKRELIDIEIDFDKELIKLHNNHRIYSFEDIRLFGRNRNRKETRLMINNTILGFRDDAFKDINGDIPTPTQMETLGKYAIEVKHQKIYNFNFLALVVLFGTEIVYSFLDNGLILFKIRITSVIVAGIVLTLFLIIGLINYLRLNKLSNPEVIDTEISDEDNTKVNSN